MSNSANVLSVELQKIIALFPSDHTSFQVVIEDENSIILTVLTSTEKHVLRCTIKVIILSVKIVVWDNFCTVYTITIKTFILLSSTILAACLY